MIRRVLLAAILAGIAAGVVMGVIQHVRLTPLILQAEQFELAEGSHDHGAAAAQSSTTAQPEAAAPAAGDAPVAPTAHDHSAMGHEAATGEHVHDANAWGPQDGLERTFYTTLTAILTAAGFALLLTGISFLAGIPITRNNGLIWGLCGFVSVSLAPAIGLPPELPGMPAAGLVARQAWWIGTIVCTGFAIWLTVARLPWFKYLGAIALALLPHVFGAPHPPDQTTSVPAGLAAEFATASLGANLLMWLLIGLFLSLALSAHEEAVTS